MIGTVDAPVARLTMGKVGDLIRRGLERKKLKQYQLAEATGLTPGAISKIISGAGGQPKAESLLQIATVLDINIDDLVNAVADDGLSRREKARIDAVPDEDIDAFLMALREEIEQDKSRTFMSQLRRLLSRRRRDDS